MSHELKAITGIFVPSGSLIQGTLASGTVTSGALGNAAVLNSSIASGQVGTFSIASGAITSDLIGASAVTSTGLAANAVTSGKITSGAVTFGSISSGAISSGMLADSSVVSGSVASGVIDQQNLASGAVFSQRYLEQLNTGLLYGGVLSYASGDSTFSIGSGLGMILVPRTGASGDPTLTYVQWNQITNQTPYYSGSVTYVSVRSGGAVQLQNDPFTLNEFLEEIVLGYVVHLSGTIINSIEPHPSLGYAGISQLDTFARVFGPLKVSGLSLSANGANLQINRSAGTAFAFGSNYNASLNSPSVTTEGPSTPSNLIYMYRSATPGRFTFQVPTANSVPGSYDNGTGTLANVQNNSWTIQRLFYVPGDANTMYVYYGRNEYANSSVALQNIFLESFNEDGFTANAAVCIGYLIVRGAAANLSLTSDAVFVDAGIFRNTAGGGGGVAGQSINDLTDVSAESAVNNQLLMYSAGEWVNSFLVSQSVGSGAIVSGGIASGQIGTYHIAQGAITDGLIASGAINSGQIGNNAVLSGNIASGQIGPNALASGVIAGLIISGSVQSGDLGTGAVNNINISSGTISNDKLVNSSITIDGSSTALGGSYSSQALTTSSGLLAGTYYPSGALTIGIASGGIVAQMMGSGSVTSNAIASGQVGTFALASGVVAGLIGSGSVGSGDLGLGAVNNENIASGTVANDKLANSTVTIAGSSTALGGSWAAQSLTAASGLSAITYYPSGAAVIGIASGGVIAQMLGSGAVTSGAIASGQVGPTALASGVIAGLIVSGSVQSGDLGLGAVNNENIASGTIANDKLANSAITINGSSTSLGGSYSNAALTIGTGLTGGSYNGSGAVTVAIASGGITSQMLADGAVASGDIAIGAVNNPNIASGTVANDKLANSTVTIAGSSTALGGSWVAAALSTSSGLLAGTYYPSGALTIGIASGGITSQMLADGAVNTNDIASGAVGTNQIASGAVTGNNIAATTVANANLVNSTVTIAGSSTALGASWAAAALTTSSGLLAGTYYPSGALTIGIASGGIVAQMMGSGSVTSNAIASGQVGTFALASGVVANLIVSGSVGSGDLGLGAVNNENIASGTVANDKLANSTVTIAGSSTALGGSWAAAALTTSSGLLAGTYYPSGSLTIGIASGGITSQMLADGSVNTNDIASGAVATNQIASGAVTGTNIAATTVANTNLVNSTVTIAGSSTALGGSWAAAALTTSSGLLAGTYYPSGSLTIGIASGGIVAQMMGSGSVTTNAIASGSVTANALASGAVSDIVGSGSVTSGDLGIGAVNNLNVASGTLSNDKLVNSTITIAGSSTALGGAWAAQSLTAASGLSAVTYYPSGAAVIGIASGGVVSGMLGNASVVSGSIGSGQVGQYHLASGAANLLLTSGIVVSGMVGNNAINSGNISSGSLGQMHMSQILLPKVEGPGRLSLFSGAPIVSGGYISGATKLYYNPYKGNTIALYDGASWLEYEINVPLMLDLNTGLQSGTMYDIFMTGAGGISGTASLSAVNWTSGGNRAPIVYQNGIPLSQFTGGRYLGTIRTTTSSTSEDSPYRRFVWNYDNRITNTLYYTDSTQHTYNSPTPRVWNLNSGSRLEFIQGVAGIGASTSCFVASYVTPGATSICSFESDGVFSGTNYNVFNTFTGLFWSQSMLMVGNCNEGYNYLQLMESCQSGTVTNVSMTLTGTIEV